MSSPAQGGFFSTPAFELFRRGMETSTVKKFRGLNAYMPVTTLSSDWAIDLLNVIVGSDGALHKFRLPQVQSPFIPGSASGPNTFFDFQQANGTRQVLGTIGINIFKFTNNMTAVTLVENNPLNSGIWSFAEAQNVLYGTNGQRVRKWDGTNWYAWGLPVAPSAPVITEQAGGAISPTFGYEWGWSWKNSGATGSPVNVGTVSPASAQIGAGHLNKRYQAATNVDPPDPQIDTLVWFRTIDGGGQLYRIAEVNINTGAVVTFQSSAAITSAADGSGKFTIIVDDSPDSALDLITIGPLINNPPLQGKFVAYGQGRVLILNLVGAPQDIIYSGYETIVIGNPPECFPPNNRLRLSVGAEQVAGGGIIHAGVVAFSQTGHMYMLRGQLEDITSTAPVVFTEYLEELPWTLGCLSHFTIQPTPHGLVWLAGDKTVQLFDGYTEPQDISYSVYPILRTITPGTEGNAVAAYFNWLERDWYCLSVAVGGSTTNNRLIFWGFNASLQEIDVWVTTIQADFVGVVSTAALQRQLVIAAQGRLSIVPVAGDTLGGITQDFTITPATNGNLAAFWRSAYFGNDQPQRSKMFRYGRIATDQPLAAWQFQYYVVDDFNHPIAQPEFIGPVKPNAGKFAINRRAKRVSVEIDFPQADAPASVTELQLSVIPSSDR